MCFREINYKYLVSKVSGLIENFNIGTFSDTLNVINVKLCMMVLHIELYLFITFSDLDVISRSHQFQTAITENFMFLL